MIPALGIGGDEQAVHRGEAYAGQAGLTLVLGAVHVAVVEDLAEDVGAIEVGIGDDPHGRVGDVRDHGADHGIDREGLVDVLTFADAGTDHQHELDRLFLAGGEVLVRPLQQAPGLLRLIGMPLIVALPSR